MKVKELSVLAGAASLLIAGTASAGFTHLSTELVQEGVSHTPALGTFSQTGPYDVWQLYANFEAGSPANVTAIGVALDGTPLTVTNVNADGTGLGSGFNNWSFGSHLPLAGNDAIYGIDPTAAALDTWFTIGNSAGFTPGIDPNTGDEFIFDPTPGHNPTLAGPEISVSAGAWFTIPESGYGHPDDQGRVLLANFVVRQGEHVEGFINLAINQGDDVVGAFFQTIPAPGAFALLGLAGLVGTRRRRA